ncbi:hypothetical protein BDR22DRAFT_834717 [Usnea florida]
MEVGLIPFSFSSSSSSSFGFGVPMWYKIGRGGCLGGRMHGWITCYEVNFYLTYFIYLARDRVWCLPLTKLYGMVWVWYGMLWYVVMLSCRSGQGVLVEYR